MFENFAKKNIGAKTTPIISFNSYFLILIIQILSFFLLLINNEIPSIIIPATIATIIVSIFKILLKNKSFLPIIGYAHFAIEKQ